MGPQEILVEGCITVWGRFFCAQQHGKTCGTITDQRVIIVDTTALIVTSELRTPPGSVADTISLDLDVPC